MSLNIKNEQVHELARRAAAATGKTQTGAIEEALTKLLESLGDSPEAAQRQTKADMIHGLLAEVDKELSQTHAGEVVKVEDLFDEESGLPR